jgi:hypothetical protein
VRTRGREPVDEGERACRWRLGGTHDGLCDPGILWVPLEVEPRLEERDAEEAVEAQSRKRRLGKDTYAVATVSPMNKMP